MKSRTAQDITQKRIKLYHANKGFESDAHIRTADLVTISKQKALLCLAAFEPIRICQYAHISRGHSELFYAVMGLPKKYRVAIFLYYYEDYSADEIAQLLGIPKSTVSTHLKRGRERLRIILSEANGHV
jgi:RNA polymerase sigma-70 factor (ECF subfamily)